MRRFATLCCTVVLSLTASVGADDTAKATDARPELAVLQSLVGTWELSVEGSKAVGTAEIKSILGGLFITEDVNVTIGGLPMQWHGVMGYDRAKKQYTGTWFDNMANTTRSHSGEVDKTNRILTFRGNYMGSGTFLWRITQDGTSGMTIEMFDVAKDGKETQVMKVRGNRKK